MSISALRYLSIAIGALALTATHASAQISLTTAVDDALCNSTKVKMAQADLDKARASLSESKDAFVPSVSTSGGYGASTGVPLAVPVVFSITAQSLVFNFQQKDYVRAAAAGVVAATFSLDEARTEVAEDTVTTYVSLNNALQRRTALGESSGIAGRLVQIVQDRFDSGLESHRQVVESHRTVTQLRLQQLRVDDEIAALSDHLARLTGVTGARTETVPDSIPAFTPPGNGNIPAPLLADSYGIQASFAAANAKAAVARGDARYRLRPQIGFSAGYSRITTLGTNYSLYYPRFANNDYSHNSIDIGIQITVPILDLVHQAKARGSAADAVRAHFDAEGQKMLFEEGRLKLQHAASELALRSELASEDRDLAQDSLETIQIQLKADATAADGPQLTPKDEQNARLQERQKFVEYLDAELQLHTTEISLMRQNGQLGDWLHIAMVAPPSGKSKKVAASLPSAPIAHP
jgi:outer membrane protein TolC